MKRIIPNITALTAFVFILFFNSCEDNGFDPSMWEMQERGDVVDVISTNKVTKENLDALIGDYLVEYGADFEVEYGIMLVSLSYLTIDYSGELTTASGLMVVPDTNLSFPVASLHHGTQTSRWNVGTGSFVYSTEALIAGAIGYAALSPDMLGLGVSEGIHPYHDEKTSASAPIDFIRAARNYCEENDISLRNEIYLAGYSEGGYVTAAVQKEIEANYSNEFNIAASAPMAGAHDLPGTAEYIIEKGEYDNPSYLAFFIVAYNETYGWDNLDYYFKPDYASIVGDLYDGSYTTTEINDELTTNLSDLFTETFLTEFQNGTETQLTAALEENSTLDFAPAAPVLIIHGDADTDVPYFNATEAEDSWTSNGGVDVNLSTVEGGTHETSVIPAVFQTIDWFQKHEVIYIADKN